MTTRNRRVALLLVPGCLLAAIVVATRAVPDAQGAEAEHLSDVTTRGEADTARPVDLSVPTHVRADAPSVPAPSVPALLDEPAREGTRPTAERTAQQLLEDERAERTAIFESLSEAELNAAHARLSKEYQQATEEAMDLQESFGMYEEQVIPQGRSTLTAEMPTGGLSPIGIRIEPLAQGLGRARLFPLNRDMHPELHELLHDMEFVHGELHERGACEKCAGRAEPRDG